MQQATTTAERVVAVLSAAYLRSGHGEAEWRAFYARTPAGSEGCCSPCGSATWSRLGCLQPGSMWTWLGGIRPALGRHCWPPCVERAGSRPRRRSFLAIGGRRSALPRRRGSRASYPPSGTPPSTPTLFTGRDLLLTELQTRLQAPGVAVRRVALTGLGGVGKTSVAVEYVYRRQADYDSGAGRGASSCGRCASVRRLAVKTPGRREHPQGYRPLGGSQARPGRVLPRPAHRGL
jgi:hypothetical protein